MKIIFGGIKTTRARAPRSLNAAKEVLGRLLKVLDGLQAWTADSRSTQSTRWTPNPGQWIPEALEALDERLQKHSVPA